MNTATKPSKAFTRAAKIIAEMINVELDDVKPTAVLTSDLGADSLDIVEIQMALEDEFSIEIVDADITGWLTVQNVLDSLTKRGVVL